MIVSCKHGGSNVYCAQCDKDVVDWYEKAPAYALKSYEAVARGCGYDVDCALCTTDYWYWYNDDLERICKGYYNTQEEAWKACCVENGLV